jgi:hypothetical protein
MIAMPIKTAATPMNLNARFMFSLRVIGPCLRLYLTHEILGLTTKSAMVPFARMQKPRNEM